MISALFGGGSSTSIKQLNELITKVSNDVASKVSSDGAGSIVQKQVNVFRGTGSNIVIKQKGSIDINVISSAEVNYSMQAEIVNKLVSEITKKDTNFPEITSKKTKTDIRNIIKNNVSSSLSMESLSTLNLSINSDNANIFEKGSEYDGVYLEQSASAVGDLINTMSSSIVEELSGGTSLASSQGQDTTDFIGNTVESVGTATNNILSGVGDLFGLDITTIILLVVIVIAGAYGAKRYSDVKMKEASNRLGPPRRGPPRRGPPRRGPKRGAPPGGLTGAPPGGLTGAPPGGLTGAPPGGLTGAPPGGLTGAPPGGLTGAPPGGLTGAPPGGLKEDWSIPPPGYSGPLTLTA